MTLTVSIGLESFAHDRPGIEALLTLLVGVGATGCVRHTIPAHDALITAGRSAIVLECARVGSRVVSRELPRDESRLILSDLRAVARSHGTFAQFAWDELNVYAQNVHDLALALDGTSPPRLGDRVSLGAAGSLQLVDIDLSAKNWRAAGGQIGIAKRLHAVARKHRLVVHSA